MKIPLIKPIPPSFEDISKHLKQSYKQNWFSNNGPAVQKLTKKYRKHCDSDIVLVSNATSGLVALIKSLKLHGKDILVPSFTFPATVHAILLAGCRPVFVDICSDLYMCLDKTEEALKKGNIAAIMPVFPLGFDIPEISFRQLAQRYNVECIFDAAACFGMKEIRGNVVYSLHITKSNGIGEGGIVQCEKAEVLEKVKRGINFGMEDDITVQWGTNAKMSEFQAAVGLASYGSMKPKTKLRSVRFKRYLNKLDNELIIPMDWDNNYQVFPLLTSKDLRNKLKEHLESAGIGTKVYYKALHEQPYFSKTMHFGSLEETSLASDSILCIPLFDAMSREEQTYIIEKVNDFVGD